MKKLYERVKGIKLDENKICILMISVFIIELIPMLLIARYNFPSVDDFGFGKVMKQALEERLTVRPVISRIAGEIYRNYMEWEGRSAAVFFNCLQPASFGEKFYFIVPYIMLSLLTIADLFLCNVIFGKFFGANRREIIIISIVWLSISIQLLPSAVQAFYWYTGAAAYVIFYSLSLVHHALLLLYIKEENKWKNISYIILNSFLVFMVARGEYTSGMLILLCYIMLICVLIVNKNKKWRALCIPFFVFVCNFAATVKAPGNTVRGGETTYRNYSGHMESCQFCN